MSEGWSKHRTLNQRVARLIELEGSSQPMLDAVITGQKREICQAIGKGVSQDRDTEIPIFDNAGLNVAIAVARQARARCITITRPTKSLQL